MTQPFIINPTTSVSIINRKNIYLGKKKTILLKKKKWKKNYLKKYTKFHFKSLIKKLKRKLRMRLKKKFLIKRKLKALKRKLKIFRRVKVNQLSCNSLRSLFFLYGSLFNYRRKKKYKKRYKRFLTGSSRLRITAKGRERARPLARRLLLKVPFMRRFLFTRMPRLFFFWFIILYSDVYFYLSKIIWNNWFKFLYASFGFNDYSKLFYKTTALYNLNYNSASFLFDNSLFFNNYNLNNFLNSRLIYTLGSYRYFFLNGIFFYNLKYISFSSKMYVNLYIGKIRLTKKNIKLKRFFIYKI